MADFAGALLGWFDRHGRRDLPWQHPRTPYRVWISEVMLQQTQVRTVIPYFERFVADLPDLRALAAAPLDRVLALWSGLGYYSRARNLHRSAQLCTVRFGGELPRDIAQLGELPGIERDARIGRCGVERPRGDGAVLLHQVERQCQATRVEDGDDDARPHAGRAEAHRPLSPPHVVTAPHDRWLLRHQILRHLAADGVDSGPQM